jgi:amidase
VGISFLGTAYSEPKLLALGYAFEQASKAIRRPVNTPALAGHAIEIPAK